jgi:hypothetical protein
MRQPMDREQEAAIQVLREAGFVPDGQAWWRQRFAKPGSKRKATVGRWNVLLRGACARKNADDCYGAYVQLSALRLVAFGE